ncbi:MAG: ATP-binding protein [Bacteroidetes bacterium]|nr:ATP-binding protein [Bacteroidota bacterium]
MKFYDRDTEITLLQSIEQKSLHTAQMTFITGRRRIGKTSLLIKAMESYPCVYFFVAKKNETLLCAEFAEELKLKLNVELFGTFKTFNAVFGYLMELSKTVHFTLIIDEFQEFYSVNPAIFSEMQHIWDSKKNFSKINLILCGSIYSMMKRIFEQSKEPLFGRATQRIHLKEFNVETIREILADNCPAHTSEDLLAFYMITGGVAKYVELLVTANAFTPDTIFDEVFSDNSLFLDEGKNVLIDEFGKDYGNYFSILSLIASSKTSRVEMESILELQIGGFLDRLEVDFGIISRVKPILSKPNSRSIKYQINDNFLNFWFRFIYKYRGAIEIGNFNYVKEIVRRDYQTYSGRILEKYFMNKMTIEGNFSSIGTYWEKGNQNEIDIVAINEIEKRLVIAEVKRKSENINIDELKQKADSLSKQFKDFSIEYVGLSMENM